MGLLAQWPEPGSGSPSQLRGWTEAGIWEENTNFCPRHRRHGCCPASPHEGGSCWSQHGPISYFKAFSSYPVAQYYLVGKVDFSKQSYWNKWLTKPGKYCISISKGQINYKWIFLTLNSISWFKGKRWFSVYCIRDLQPRCTNNAYKATI